MLFNDILIPHLSFPRSCIYKVSYYYSIDYSMIRPAYCNCFSRMRITSIFHFSHSQ
jgi:hypothetical protein